LSTITGLLDVDDLGGEPYLLVTISRHCGE